MNLTRAELATMIDHTLLKPEATPDQVRATLEEGARLGCFSVCVSPSQVPLEAPEGLKVCVVVGLPSGAHQAEAKAYEAKLAAEAGVDEIDMVINLSHALTGAYDKTEAEVRAVREAAPDVLLKVIIESAALNDDQLSLIHI